MRLVALGSVIDKKNRFLYNYLLRMRLSWVPVRDVCFLTDESDGFIICT